MSDGWDPGSSNRVPVPDLSIDQLFTQQSQQSKKQKRDVAAKVFADKREASKALQTPKLTQSKGAQMRRDTADVSMLLI